MPGFFSKERIVAGPGYNRWWTILAALLINLSIGQAYAFSVFNIPLTRVLGVSGSAPEDWKLTTLGWVFTLAYVFLGLSAGLGGRWQDRVGPRLSAVVSAWCWATGFLLSALGVYTHQIALLYLGYGVVGGCGLGLGFNTPISTLIRWFPDRRGMATGMAIMGFGGGAIIAAPLSQWLMRRFASPSSVGVAETFITLGVIYFVAMMAGAMMFRLPPPEWRPPGWQEPEVERRVVPASLGLRDAVRTPQFCLLWAVLFFSVTAGIGVLGQAAAMIQEVFSGFSASAAAAFVALLSFFNMGGRIVWSALSDQIGRKATYTIFFTVGPVLYALIPWSGHAGSVTLFVACFAVILSVYGGSFASLPAYVADVFGPRDVGAIHGRVLTALSAAGIAGPVVLNYLREYQIARGVPAAHAYDSTMYLMAGLLVTGYFCNRALRPVSAAATLASAEQAPAGAAGESDDGG